MLGRTAGVVALRDGLYSACQAYVNKVIGKDAYALILSQFGNLLVAVANGGGGGAAPSANPSGGAGSPAGVAVAVSAGAQTTPSAKQASDANAGNSQVSVMQQEAVQALFVACISENDPSLHEGYANRNPLLSPEYCSAVMGAILQALPDLMKPPSPPVTTAAAHAQRGKSVPKPKA